ncbi:MAG: hypothetical protein J0I45_11195 [Bosea sp.]|nr:hypothetical protein [Bosea sp. (in: a-proteobacteria)]
MKYLSNLTRPEGDPKILATGPSAVPGPDRLAKGLGWFSIGLGLTQLLAPHILTRTLGLRGREGLMRVFGAREIASGMLTLSTEKQTGMTSRVVGDLLDLAVLGAALGSHNRKRDNAGVALAMTAGLTLIDIAVRKALADTHGRRGRPRDYADRSGFPSKPHQSGQPKLDGPKSEDAKTGGSSGGSKPNESRPDDVKRESDRPESAKPDASRPAGPAGAGGSGGVKPGQGAGSPSSGHATPGSGAASVAGQDGSRTGGAAQETGPSGGPISLQEPPAATSR